jgi:hypothetical protein
MSAPKTVSKTESRDLAARIYIDLVVRNVDLSAGSVKLPVSAENLAKLAYKLAEAFHKIETEVEDAIKPDTSYKLGADDIAGWMK